MKFKRIFKAEEIEAGKIYFETSRNEHLDDYKLKNIITVTKSTSKAGMFLKNKPSHDKDFQKTLWYKGFYIWQDGTKSKSEKLFSLRDCGVLYGNISAHNNHKLYELIEGDIEELYELTIKEFEYWAEEQTMWNNLTIGW